MAIRILEDYGYIQSVLDGTEHVAEWRDFDIPAAFDYRGIMPPVMDQGSTSMCVAYSLCSVMDAVKSFREGSPGRHWPQHRPDIIYDRRLNRRVPGMMPKTALSFLRHEGLSGTRISNYAMVGNVETAKRCLLMSAPFILGLRVYEDAGDEFWRPAGRCLGGHCVTCVGYDDERKALAIRNSWGESFGDGGHAYLPYGEWGQVLEAWTVTL